jgi:phosphatidylglycerol---prolipoprotein diacylglyceryl transferase
MIDEHIHPENWGIKPVLFEIGSLKISSYAFFVLLGLVVGLIVYYILAKKDKKLNENSFYILITGIVCGTLGAKIPIWIINFSLIVTNFPDINYLLSGRTITGGLIGGTLGVMYIKKKLKIKEKKGNLFAPGIAIGITIGRIGCFLAGCCYGIQTSLPFGVNFGDGILRHPTQIYEAIFMFFMFFFLLYKKKSAKPGQLFFILMNSYFTFRFFEEFIREGNSYLGFTVFQFICIGGLIFINLNFLKKIHKKLILFVKI